MAAGDIAVYREATGGDLIAHATNPGADFDHDFDTTVREDGIYSKSGSDITLGEAGHYLVFGNSRYNADPAGSGRHNLVNRFVINSTEIDNGWSQSYQRDSSGANDNAAFSAAIVDVSLNDTVTFRVNQTGGTGGGDLTRVADSAGLQILKLDDSWGYCRLSKSTNQSAPTSTTFGNAVTWNVQDELDTGDFSHTSGSASITLDTIGHYLVVCNTSFLLAGGGDRHEFNTRFTIGGTEVEGTRAEAYAREQSGTNKGIAVAGIIIETTAINQVLEVETNRTDGSSSDSVILAGETAISIVKLTEADAYIRLEESTDVTMNPTTETSFGWDTELEVDAASWVHPATDSRLEVNADGDYLFMGNMWSDASATRAVPWRRWRLNDTTTYQYGSVAGYGRSSGANNVGGLCGLIATDLTDGDFIELTGTFLSDNSGSTLANFKGIQGVRLSLLFTVDTVIDAVTGTYVCAGVAAATLYDRLIDAVTGVYACVGVAANTLYDRIIDAVTGTYACVGVAAATLYDRLIDAVTGTYACVGVAANTLHDRVIDAVTGAYVCVGVAAATLKATLLSAVTGIYACVGVAADTLHDRVIAAVTGTYACVGVAANTIRSIILAAVTGAYACVGVAAATLHNRVLLAVTGVYTCVGVAANLIARVVRRIKRGPWSLHGSLHKARNVVKREVK